MRKLLRKNLWSAAVSCLGRSVQLLAVLFALSLTANAQDTKWLTEDKSTSDPTGISEIHANKPAAISNEWYTLEGLRLDKAPTAKGIYIHNGVKRVISGKEVLSNLPKSAQ